MNKTKPEFKFDNKKLRSLMAYERMTMEEFAKRLGISRGTVSHYCSGEYQPTMGVMFDIMKIFKIDDINDLLIKE